MRFLTLALCCLIPQLSGAAVDPAPERRNITQALAELRLGQEFQSTDQNIRAIELDFATRDLVLAPQAQLSVTRYNEQREQTGFLFKDHTSTVSGSVSKPFSTGTKLTFTPSLEIAHIARSNGTVNVGPLNTFDYQFALTQNLWQDFFGRSTDLRWRRESADRKAQLATALQAQAQMQADFETAYWTWAMAIRERDLRRKNVTRGEEILRWTKDRYRRAAADGTDLVQAEALLANRQLQLLTVEQSLVQAGNRLAKYVRDLSWQPDPDEIGVERALPTMLTKWPVEDLGEGVVRLELLAARSAALVNATKANEAREAIRPTLQLQATYGHNALDQSSAWNATEQAFRESHDDSTIALVFSSVLDVGLERKKVESARALADAADRHRHALEMEAPIAWGQLQKDWQDLRERTAQAKRFMELQWKKADSERERYRLGRSTAFQVITFEQDAAESEINMWTLFANMRKTEASARLYAR